MENTFTSPYPSPKKNIFIRKAGIMLLLFSEVILFIFLISSFNFNLAIEEEVIDLLQRPSEEKMASIFFTNPEQKAPLSNAFLDVYNMNHYQPLWMENDHTGSQFN